MLGLGGKITIDAGDFSDVSLLPQQPFRVTAIQLVFNKRVTDDSLKRLRGLTKITTLDLSGTKISGAGLEHIIGLTTLNFLGLGSNPVNDADLENLKGLTNLTALFLHNTQVGDAGLAHLKGLPKLTALRLQGTKVTDAGAIELHKALPKCKITYGPADGSKTIGPNDGG